MHTKISPTQRKSVEELNLHKFSSVNLVKSFHRNLKIVNRYHELYEIVNHELSLYFDRKHSLANVLTFQNIVDFQNSKSTTLNIS